ncbi:MAG: hypothetical protein L3J17_06090 [Candidatus Jettenia sp.]|nr:MAG: hypothetical protein L3J17_06090 [Candidatus Jettenia sp.]
MKRKFINVRRNCEECGKKIIGTGNENYVMVPGGMMLYVCDDCKTKIECK